MKPVVGAGVLWAQRLAMILAAAIVAAVVVAIVVWLVIVDLQVLGL